MKKILLAIAGFSALYLLMGPMAPSYGSGSVSLNVTPSQPDGNNGYYQTQPTFNLTLSGLGYAAYKIDNGSWFQLRFKCENGSGSINPLPTLPKGTHTIYYALVECGYTTFIPQGTIYSKTIKYDSDSPKIVFSYPKDNSTVNSKDVLISGTVSDATSSINSLMINGKSASFSSSGNFSIKLSLNQGLNRVVGVAYDKAGNSTSKEHFISYVPGDSSNNSEEALGTTNSNQDFDDEKKDGGENQIASEDSLGESTPSANTIDPASNGTETAGASEANRPVFNKIMFALVGLIALGIVGLVIFRAKIIEWISKKLSKN